MIQVGVSGAGFHRTGKIRSFATCGPHVVPPKPETLGMSEALPIVRLARPAIT